MVCVHSAPDFSVPPTAFASSHLKAPELVLGCVLGVCHLPCRRLRSRGDGQRTPPRLTASEQLLCGVMVEYKLVQSGSRVCIGMRWLACVTVLGNWACTVQRAFQGRIRCCACAHDSQQWAVAAASASPVALPPPPGVPVWLLPGLVGVWSI